MQFLPTFAHFSELRLTEAEGARMLFGLTLCIAIGRLVGIFIVLKVKPHFILLGNFVLLLTANLVLLLIAQTSVPMLWVGSCLIGLGLSTVYPGKSSSF